MTDEVMWRLPNESDQGKCKFARFLDKETNTGIGVFIKFENIHGLIMHMGEDSQCYMYCEIADIPGDCNHFSFLWQHKRYEVEIKKTENSFVGYNVTVAYKSLDTNLTWMLKDKLGNVMSIRWSRELRRWIPSLLYTDELFSGECLDYSITMQDLCDFLNSEKFSIKVLNNNEPNG